MVRFGHVVVIVHQKHDAWSLDNRDKRLIFVQVLAALGDVDGESKVIGAL